MSRIKRRLTIAPEVRKGASRFDPPKRKSIMIPEELHDELSVLVESENVSYPVLLQALLDFYKQNATA